MNLTALLLKYIPEMSDQIAIIWRGFLKTFSKHRRKQKMYTSVKIIRKRTSKPTFLGVSYGLFSIFATYTMLPYFPTASILQKFYKWRQRPWPRFIYSKNGSDDGNTVLNRPHYIQLPKSWEVPCSTRCLVTTAQPTERIQYISKYLSYLQVHVQHAKCGYKQLFLLLDFSICNGQLPNTYHTYKLTIWCYSAKEIFTISFQRLLLCPGTCVCELDMKNLQTSTL